MTATIRRHSVTAATISAALFAYACTSRTDELHSTAGTAQGTTYSLQWTGSSANADAVRLAVEREIERIDTLLSNYRPDSIIEGFNATRSTEPQHLPAELIALLRVASGIHAASAACFDPTVRPLVRAWGFDTDHPAAPEQAALEAARQSVGFDKLVILDSERVRKTVPELELDMASIGQGYTVDRLAAVLEQHGASSYLAEIGGEVVARGTKPDGTRWRVGIENPDPEGGAGPAITLPASDRTAVVTSGTYRHYFDATGRRFSHIIDPRTGSPVAHDLVAVTAIGRDATVAAAWGTALLCLGPQHAAEIAKREGLAAFFWQRQGDAVTLSRSEALATEWRTLLD